jgi:hypothetical protein
MAAVMNHPDPYHRDGDDGSWAAAATKRDLEDVARLRLTETRPVDLAVAGGWELIAKYMTAKLGPANGQATWTRRRGL